MDRQHSLRKGQFIELYIQDIAFGGVGIGKIPTDGGDLAVFVENTIPGQKVKAQVAKSAKRHVECKLTEVLIPSPEEVPTPYQSIPGAPYTTWPIEKQAAAKRRTATELYRRIGHIADIESLVDEYIESPLHWHYRNKMEYSFSAIRFDLQDRQEHDDFALGFKHRGTWWMVENLDGDSGMFDAQLENAFREIRLWCESTGFPAWHPPQRKGFFRYLVARKSFHTNELLLNLVTSEENVEAFDPQAFAVLCERLLPGRLAGIIHTINPDTGDRVETLSGSSHLLRGKDFITETILGLTFEVRMASFFQTNPLCAARLYQKVIDYVNLNGTPKGAVLDLFCGTGTITQLIARHTSAKVTGVDITEKAIEDAKRSAQRNQVGNAEFFAADVGKFLTEHPEFQGAISTLVLDPPRAGIMPKSLQKIIALGAERIVYVSCNPATQARDAEVLAGAGYKLKQISFVDQFPHTAHLEAVTLFEK